MRALIVSLSVGCLATLLVIGCGTARRAQPLLVTNQPPPTRELQNGERLFDLHCNACHPGGEAGVGIALNNKPLPSALIRAQVRAGVGAMPGFSEDVISDAELDAIVAYMDWLSEQNVEPQPETEDGRPEFP